MFLFCFCCFCWQVCYGCVQFFSVMLVEVQLLVQVFFIGVRKKGTGCLFFLAKFVLGLEQFWSLQYLWFRKYSIFLIRIVFGCSGFRIKVVIRRCGIQKSLDIRVIGVVWVFNFVVWLGRWEEDFQKFILGIVFVYFFDDFICCLESCRKFLFV